jgi:hypothetical protein
LILRRKALVIGTTLLASAVGACAPDGLAFRIDERLDITAPSERELVSLPVTIRWTVKDLEDEAAFAVYIDREPVGPGERFKPNALDAFRTSDTQLRLERIPGDNADKDDDDERHTATIVYLNAAGRRVGEASFEVTFDVEDR